MPKRIQMSRQHPWRADNPAAVIVSRPTKWGNPCKVGKDWEPIEAVSVYENTLLCPGLKLVDLPFTAEDVRRELKGKDLACWCPLDQPCHADVLLLIANMEA